MHQKVPHCPQQLVWYVADDFSPFLHTDSVLAMVVLRFWSPYRLVDVVPVHIAVYAEHFFHSARHCFVG